MMVWLCRYVAPEYAMTGHLLVKSDVYSYGVVLLELLSGRQPVDMSQPQGQENLVTWARPLLTTKEGLELLVDPNLRNKFPFDNYARVAAIASMCVQPEVSHRPFMSEVVQSLKSVYDDSDPSEIGSNEDSSNLNRNATPTDPRTRFLPNPSFISIDYDSGPQARDMDGRPLSASAVLSGSGRFIRQLSGSFRRHSASGPLKTSTGQKPSAWYRFRGPKVTRSDHGVARHDNRLSHRDYSNPWPWRSHKGLMWLWDIKDSSRLRSVFVSNGRDVVGHRFAGSEWLNVSHSFGPSVKVPDSKRRLVNGFQQVARV